MAQQPAPAPTDTELAAALLRDAGALARSIRAESRTALLAGRHLKGGISDFATAADLAAERLIFDALRAARPDDSILGEEGAGHLGTSGRWWVIDPVDGTFNFASGSSYWCTALALVAVPPAEEGATAELPADAEVLLGAVFQPEEDKLWLGGTTEPASLNGQHLAPLAPASVETLAAGTYIHPGWLSQPRAAVPWQRAAELPATLRMLGSGSCDLSRVAQGELGVWFQHSVPSWDWLPGKGIVEAAGGDTAVVRVNGLDWCIAGAPGAVAQLAGALGRGVLG